ncbi:heat-inducible transcriptional repressor HrcA [Bifidobacterium eulemuris]|uniref:Heat-inducible transcription repressor HrcA n=1 Tax=Bifidobacterium eulemuris TaxID=1765219 RepID=A0A261GCN4_9BIFI|nr:heat-inducible transcriptional repressor HrcA [Bifidobacterium eulemuris]OZG69188.1 heat-inducible transcription repressor hrcA [Bifidobacterium eulemuris]QOL31300.1 heat-inducible transcriptional repressor HrcA [Bifidobacterium eulemuris]
MTQSRRMLVLRAVVEDYIRSQEPVGSSALTKQHDLGVSSATIRNDMAALEDEGYLIQPHTSAGRVPTEKGYRYFVDRLATVVPLSAAQRRGIDSFLSGSVSLQDTLRRAARLLSEITGQVAVVAAPSLAKSTLRHVELVPVAMNTLLAVVITDTGRVAQHTIVVNPMPEQDAAARFTNAVNAEAASLPLMAAARKARSMAAMAQWKELSPLAESLAQAFENMADSERTNELYMSGTSRLAQQHAAIDDLAPLFDALEEQVMLMRLMSAMPRHDGVGVAIGSETHTPGLLHASVVASGYGQTKTRTGGGEDHDAADGSSPDRRNSDMNPSRTSKQSGDMIDRHTAYDEHAVQTDDIGQNDAEPVAFVGSIGPTHMDYAATIAAVQAVARYLTASLAHGDDGD